MDLNSYWPGAYTPMGEDKINKIDKMNHMKKNKLGDGNIH